MQNALNKSLPTVSTLFGEPLNCFDIFEAFKLPDLFGKVFLINFKLF